MTLKRILWIPGSVLFAMVTVFIFTACNAPDHTSDRVVIKKFYDGINQGNFREVDNYSSDSIQILREGAVVISSKSELYKGFQWDSVFTPEIEIIHIAFNRGIFEVTLSKICDRLIFLHDTAYVYIAEISVVDHQVQKIAINTYLNLDMEKIRSREKALAQWVKENHPNLMGFNEGQTLSAAQDYLKAIHLFQENQFIAPKDSIR